MRESKVLKKIRAGQFARTCGLGHFMPFFVRYAAHNGYDCIWLDLEHRAMSVREVQSLLALGHQFDIDIMVRPPTTERTALYRYFEDGAAGLMIPFTSDPDIARRIVESVKFPPVGNRGIDGAGLDADFGLGHFFTENSTWIEDANQETFIVGQIETPGAVAKVDDIAAVPGLDVLFIGPGDLGMRIEREADCNLTLDGAMDAVAAAAEKHGKAWGITAGSPEMLAERRGRGAQMGPWGGDFFLTGVLQQCSAEIDAVLDE